MAKASEMALLKFSIIHHKIGQINPLELQKYTILMAKLKRFFKKPKRGLQRRNNHFNGPNLHSSFWHIF